MDPQIMHLARAHYLEQHAREHERATAELERFENVECKSLSPSERALCPMLGPIVRIDDIPSGVRIRYREGSDVESILPRMRCHYAYARARGFAGIHDCPLYIKGEDFRPAPEPNAVDVLVRDQAAIAELRKRVRADGTSEAGR